MNDLLQIGTRELARFLGVHLPALSAEWWKTHVEERLGFQQQRMVQEKRFTTLDQLDFAALLRLLDQNWYGLSQALSLPREGRHWVKEMQTVRNRWAHLPASAIAPSEIYRDADTLGRLLDFMDCDPGALGAVEEEKERQVTKMAGVSAPATPERPEAPARSESQGHPSGNDTAPPTGPDPILVRPKESRLPEWAISCGSG